MVIRILIYKCLTILSLILSLILSFLKLKEYFSKIKYIQSKISYTKGFHLMLLTLKNNASTNNAVIGLKINGHKISKS